MSFGILTAGQWWSTALTDPALGRETKPVFLPRSLALLLDEAGDFHMVRPSFNVFANMVAVVAVELSLATACGAQPLPDPTGSYPVGRTTFRLADDQREFVVQAWSPARSGAEGKRAPWVPADQLSHE